MRLVVAQTDELTLWLPWSRKIEEANIPASLYKLFDVGHPYLINQVPSTLDPLLQWQYTTHVLLLFLLWK